MTDHARVLAAIARDPGVRLRDIALEVQLTERAVQAIVTDLDQAGYLTRPRTGRRNLYRIAAGTWLRHPAESGLSVAELRDLLARAHHDGAPGQGAAEPPPGAGEQDGDGRRPAPQRSDRHAGRQVP
ncbi:helix-turn-helix transcriptional regulator [Kitasatospora sp. NPDC059973]|uniref:helix-turn-helix transcriptional regulator n=1 Tax=Kitasatospora sp. NPDC059973 TaxID=3347020 RepID=UPI0036C492D0